MIRWVHGLAQDALPAAGCVVSIGSFDGVHRGHAAVVAKMIGAGREKGRALLVASFEPHPRAVLAGIEVPRLTDLKQRAHLLAELGVSVFVALQFDKKMAQMTPEVFVEEILVNQLKANAVVVGHDHRFGKGRAGDLTLLREMGSRLGFDVHEIKAHEMGDSPVSSSRIRRALSAGAVTEAADMLGRPYDVSGTVIKGAGRGHQIGVPTANLEPLDPRRLIPSSGVYAVKTWLPDTEAWLPGMMNIGIRPTFDGDGVHLEVNVIDWSGDLYGHEVRVEFFRRIRDEVKFDGKEALLKQLNLDRERCRALLRGLP